MLDELYTDIGGKIKNWAKWIFIVEAIGAIITGLVLLCTDADLVVSGLLVMFLGPFVAWVSSWILYGFGELIEKTVNNESNTRDILRLMKDGDKSASDVKPVVQPKPAQARPASVAPPAGGWVCTCGRTHQNYEGTCICGVTKHDAKAAQNK